PKPVLAAVQAMLADPPAVLRRRTVTGGWADLPRMLTAAGDELERHRRIADEARSAIDAAEADLVAAARSHIAR
ncbi:MAG: hypothetical protein ACRD0C_23790, partial [Acidimicrobiia bacterium]